MEQETPSGSPPSEFDSLLKEWWEERPHVMRRQAECAFARDSFSGWSLYRSWMKDASPYHGALYDFLSGFDHVSFDRLTPNARRILWKGVLLHQGLTEEQFPYPANLLALDDAERAAKVAAERESSGLSETPAYGSNTGQPRRSPHPFWILVAGVSVAVMVVSFTIGFHRGQSDEIRDWVTGHYSLVPPAAQLPPAMPRVYPEPPPKPLLPAPSAQQ